MRPPKLRPRNIIISHVYSDDNKGDAALTSVLISDLRRVFPGVCITILRLESVKKGDYFEGVPEQPSFMYYVANRYRHPLLKLLYAVYMLTATLWWAVWRRMADRNMYLPSHLREVAHLYAAADLIVAVGGGYIRSRPGLLLRWNIPLLLHPFLLGRLLGKPTVLYSQSVGPFAHAYEGRLAAFVLNRMQVVMLREDTSVKLLAELGVSKNVIRTVDSGFLLTGKGTAALRADCDIPDDRLMIGVTVRSWLHGQAQHAYETAVASALDKAIGRYRASVVFIPQVTAAKGDDDRQASLRVYNLMRRQKHAHVITAAPDHHQIKTMYNELDLLLGTRFHSVIFSLTSYVPVIAIEYEHKTSGIMSDLGLEKWVIAIEDATPERLWAMLKELVDQKADYQASLHRSIPPYVERAKKTADMLAVHYKQFVTTQASRTSSLEMEGE